MPLWVQPVLRSLQEALETEGLNVPITSTGVSLALAAEAAGTKAKNPPIITRIIRGNVYKAS